MAMPRIMLAPALHWARRLRHPTLFKLTAALFVLDLLLPDPVPMLDELLLGLATLVLANWKVGRTIPPIPAAASPDKP